MNNEVVIVDAMRSPLTQRPMYGRAHRELRTEELLDVTVSGLLHRAKINEDEVTTIVTVGDRAAAFLQAESWSKAFQRIELHDAVSATAAIQFANNVIKSDPRKVVLVAGAASGNSWFDVPNARMKMPAQPADQWRITRQSESEFASASHQRARECALSGDFRRELIPLELHVDLEVTEFVASDELRQGAETPGALRLAPHPATNLTSQAESLTCQLPHHYANAAKGAGALVLTSASRADELGIHPRGRLVGVEILFDSDLENASTSELDLVRSYLRQHGVSPDCIDQYEVPEDTARGPLIWLTEFGINTYMLNPRGGALAFGHLAELEGIRALATMLSALEDTGGIYGLVATSSVDGSGVILVECSHNP
ncbi:acetyl-CoA acetyltransferase [Rhodococcus sp. 008]|uniref:thiolase family protein n=1 Tax=Rhodococcus sp. 008 TaxID=1723645 RepID=UPI0008063363|nr:acetyl-CoA acetyltransferase [Rhodococcus sp. 008]ANQ71269.1 acetyl-CoA acetyltransferase [Rhodococcus sp. 008]